MCCISMAATRQVQNDTLLNLQQRAKRGESDEYAYLSQAMHNISYYSG